LTHIHRCGTQIVVTAQTRCETKRIELVDLGSPPITTNLSSLANEPPSVGPPVDLPQMKKLPFFIPISDGLV
jgi:hypothetical protein